MRSVRTRIHAAALILVLSAAAPYQARAEGNADLSRISIENFGQISDVYYRGAQPKGDDESTWFIVVVTAFTPRSVAPRRDGGADAV